MADRHLDHPEARAENVRREHVERRVIEERVVIPDDTKTYEAIAAVFHNGETLKVGDRVELTDAQAVNFSDRFRAVGSSASTEGREIARIEEQQRKLDEDRAKLEAEKAEHQAKLEADRLADLERMKSGSGGAASAARTDAARHDRDREGKGTTLPRGDQALPKDANRK